MSIRKAVFSLGDTVRTAQRIFTIFGMPFAGVQQSRNGNDDLETRQQE